jgi:leucyl-tRNA synthetase
VTAEIWEQRHPTEKSVHLMKWPVADPELVVAQTVTMVVQVNGKVRARLEIDPNISESEAQELALADEEIKKILASSTIQRVVSRPPRLVNIIL